MKLYTSQECLNLSNLLKEGNKKIQKYTSLKIIEDKHGKISMRVCCECKYFTMHGDGDGDLTEAVHLFCRIGGFRISTRGSCPKFKRETGLRI